MKTIRLLWIFILLGSFSISYGQTIDPTNGLNNSGPEISIRAGYDIPAFDNNTPYINYKPGLDLGLSFDYFWDWYGIGADVDYITNKPESTYPQDSKQFSSYTLTENNVNRLFYGIGPSFKYQKSNKSSLELKLRGGLANIKGGKTELTGNTTLLNFHAGYDAKNVFSTKASLQYNRFFTPNFGFHIGAYYLQHYNVKELVDAKQGISAGYHPFLSDEGQIYVDPQSDFVYREEACNCEVHSVGVYAGLTFKFGAKKAKEVCPVCQKAHQPFCCATCGCDVTITARDKFTKELLNNTDVVLVDDAGNIAQSGTTNSYGVVVFKNVQPNNYTVKGKLYDVDLENNAIYLSEFDACKTSGTPIQKEILYTDENFIINGKVVICNTAQGIGDVQVMLKNNQMGIQKQTNTDMSGNFIFHALENANYSIYGKKADFLSQTMVVSTKDYDRNKTLFIKLEICMDKVDCGKGLVLKNILYDLDKDFIREDAKPELNRLVQFMVDNPSVKVELSSHTDCRASHAYNDDLSQRRANNAVNYIVSQGISRSRLIGKGYGERRLLNRCADGVQCSEAEHDINRRTEMTVICPN